MPAPMSTTPHRGYEIPNADPQDLVPQIQAMLTDIDNDVNTITGGAPATLADPGSNGIVVRTSTSVTTVRAMANAAAGITWTNADGVSGNPTPVLANDLAALEALSTAGFAKRTGTDTWTAAALVAGDIPDISATYATKSYADSLVVGLLDDRGNYDASGNVFPSSGGSGSAGAILKGDIWFISVAGTLGGVAVNIGDQVRALVDSPGSTAGNWAVAEANIGYVPLNQALANGKIYVGNGSGIGTAVTPSGDVTMSNAGVTAIGALKVLNAMIANGTIDLTAKVTGILPNANGGTGTSTSFTAGSVVFAGTSGVYNQDNANFFWNSATHRLGIGTASPGAKVEIGSVVANTFGMILTGNATTGQSYGPLFRAGTNSSDKALLVQDVTASLNYFVVRGDGNVGIQTGTPGYQLEVNGVGSATDGIFLNASSFTSIPNPGSIADKFVINPRGINIASDTITLSGGYQPTGGIAVSGSRATPMVGLKNSGGPSLIVEAGNVGILTSSPGQPLEVAGNVFINSATANLYLKDTSTGFQSTSTTVITPQASNTIRSTNYTSGLLGWNISALGNAEFNNVDVRGAIHASIFTYNAINVTAGTQLITPSGAKLKSDVVVSTSPTYGTTTFTIDAVDQDGITHAASQLFAVNDIIRLKDGLVGDTWFKVTAVSDQTSFWRYTASIQAGSNNVTYRAGQGIPDYGVSGKGGIMLTADQTNAPYLQMFTHAATFSSADASGTLNLTPQLRLGNLNGSYGYSSDVYGFAAGQYGSASKAWISVDQTNGIRIGSNNLAIANWDLSGNILLGLASAGNSNLYLTSGTVDLRNNTTSRIHLAADGSGYLANSLIAWDTSGNLTVNGNAVIGGVTIGSGKMYVGTGTFNNTNTGFYVDSTGQFSLKDKLSWDGSNLNINGGGTFSGALSAATGTFAGSLSAASGTFAGSLTAASGAITGTLTMSGSGSAIAIGSTPPTSASAGTGIWEDRTGIYGLVSSTQFFKLDATNGALLAGAGILSLNNTYGVQIISTGAGITWRTGSTTYGTISQDGTNLQIYGTAPTGNVASVQLQSQSPDNAGLPSFDLISRTSGISARLYDAGAGTLLGLVIGANAAPNAMLDVRGDAVVTGSVKSAFTLTHADSTLANGANNDVAFPSSVSSVTYTGPTAAYNVTGFGAGTNGQMMFVTFNVAQVLTLKHFNTGSASGNRLIVNSAGTDLTFTANGTVRCIFIYDQSIAGGAGAWVLYSALQ